MSQEQVTQKKVGLALSGGFIRAMAEIGVIEVLKENGIPIHMVAGCSSGAAVAGAYAAGNLDRLKKIMLEVRRRDYWKIIFEPTLPTRGFLKGERNRVFFEEFVDKKEFKDLDIPFIAAATDLLEMKESLITEGSVSRAIQACTSVPGIFVPVRWGDKLLADGANFNTIPSKALYDAGMDYVIAVHVTKSPNMFTQFFSLFHQMRQAKQIAEQKHIRKKKTLTIFGSVWRAAYLSSKHKDNFHFGSYKYDILIEPAVKEVKRMHISQVEYCIHQGRAAAEAAIVKIKQDLNIAV